MKREHNHLQARLGQAGTQLQNATATVYGQKKLLAALQQVHAPEEANEPVLQQRTNHSENQVSLSELESVSTMNVAR